ncbi:MAG: type II toxin-antitoxin system prevent-host-death family antitoxin, partial [Propionibacteriaceae bacterium]|nr:type II toxin-antitoxin system prevent-host-death family antitoxin [Propionibacteriaceae bacterium]
MASVGLRELRQSASQVVRRVEAGETITVTVQGRVAAVLAPADRGRLRRRSIPGAEVVAALRDGAGAAAPLTAAE